MPYFLKKIKSKEDLEFFRQPSKEVQKNDKNLNDLILSMLNIIYKENGLGMAAVMAGVHKRVIVVDLQENNRKNPIILINPEITSKSDEMVDSKEASISINGVRESIKRYKNITVKYLNKNFEEEILNADGLLSICIQHETDHLIGKLYIDYLSKIKKDFIIKKVKKRLVENNG